MRTLLGSRGFPFQKSEKSRRGLRGWGLLPGDKVGERLRNFLLVVTHVEWGVVHPRGKPGTPLPRPPSDQVMS